MIKTEQKTACLRPVAEPSPAFTRRRRRIQHQVERWAQRMGWMCLWFVAAQLQSGVGAAGDTRAAWGPVLVPLELLCTGRPHSAAGRALGTGMPYLCPSACFLLWSLLLDLVKRHSINFALVVGRILKWRWVDILILVNRHRSEGLCLCFNWKLWHELDLGLPSITLWTLLEFSLICNTGV